MSKPFIVANVREVLDQYDREEISFSKMVEMLNEIAEKFYNPEKKRIIKAGFTTYRPGMDKWADHA